MKMSNNERNTAMYFSKKFIGGGGVNSFGNFANVANPNVANPNVANANVANARTWRAFCFVAALAHSCCRTLAVIIALRAAFAPSPSSAAPASALWVGGDASAPNDPTVLANWAADSAGTAISELPGSSTCITNNVTDDAKIAKIADGMSIVWGYPYIGRGSGNSGRVEMSGGNLTIANLYPGWASGTGEFVQSGGKVTVTGFSKIGNTGTGTLTITGGTFTAPSANFWFGTEAQGKGYLYVNGNADIKFSNTYFPYDLSGDTCYGYLNISNGTLSVESLHISSGKNNNQHGYITQTGGHLKTHTGSNNGQGIEYIGDNGGATYTQTGGTNTAVGVIYIGYGARVNGYYYITDGEVFANAGINLAYNSNHQNNEGGQLTLNKGAVVTTKYIQRGSAGNGNKAARVVCNGGKIVATANYTSWFKNLQFTYTAAGVTIDTKTYNVTETGCTTGYTGTSYTTGAAEGSSITKIGSGKLSYSALPLVDEIAVEEGTLAITADASVTSRAANVISVASGAAFDCGGYTLAAQGLAGSGSVSNGTVTVAGTLAPDGVFAFGDNTAVTVAGTLALDAGDVVTLGEGSTLDLSSATVALAETEISTGWTFASGGANSITGTPAVSGPAGYTVLVSADGSSAKICRKGFLVIVK